jgi:hypothetical protein
MSKSIKSYAWVPTRLIDLKVGDVIAEDFEKTTTDAIAEIIEENGGYTAVTIADITTVDKKKSTVYTLTTTDGETIVLKEKHACYCGCKDYWNTIVIVPA